MDSYNTLPSTSFVEESSRGSFVLWTKDGATATESSVAIERSQQNTKAVDNYQDIGKGKSAVDFFIWLFNDDKIFAIGVFGFFVFVGWFVCSSPGKMGL